MQQDDVLYELLKETRDDVKALRLDLHAHIVSYNNKLNEHVSTYNEKLNELAKPQTAFKVVAEGASKLGGILGLILTAVAVYKMMG